MGRQVILGQVLQREGVVLETPPLPQDRRLMPLTHRPRPLLRSRKTELDREAVHLLRALVHDICWGTPAGQWDEDGHVQPARDTEDTILNVPPDTFILSSYFQVLRMLRKFLFILLGLLQFHPDGRSKSCPGLCFWVILPDHVPY